MLRTKFVKKGGWRTLEVFWNATGTAFFRLPPGAQIKVRYGVGFLGWDRQKQTLAGDDVKRLSVGKGSIAGARMQMKSPADLEVNYDVYPGDVAIKSPKIPL